MGLFHNYTRPGRGIDKDAPRKKGIFRYFEIFFRKIWKLWKINMLTFLASLPFMVVMFYFAPISLDSPLFKVLADIPEDKLVILEMTVRSFFAVTAYTLLGSGPASAAYAYITRCFTREEHAWLWSDFKDKFKENFKQAMILSVIDIVGLFLLMNGLGYYYTQYINTHSVIFLAATVILMILLLIFIFTNYHIYQLMVTFENKTIQLIKNAIMFSLIQLPMNIFVTVISTGITLLVFVLFPSFPLAITFSFLIGVSLARFPIEYASARAIEKKLLANIPKSDSKQNEGEE